VSKRLINLALASFSERKRKKPDISRRKPNNFRKTKNE